MHTIEKIQMGWRYGNQQKNNKILQTFKIRALTYTGNKCWKEPLTTSDNYCPPKHNIKIISSTIIKHSGKLSSTNIHIHGDQD